MLSANGLHGHIRNNTMKSALLLAGFVVLIAAFWWAWCVIATAVKWQGGPHESDLWNILLAATAYAATYWYMPVFGSVAWFGIAYGFHSNLIRAATRAKPVTRKEQPELYNLVENLSIAAGLPMPQIEIMETEALNAYAAGLGPNGAVVAVTRGLLEKLDRNELEAVLAHEISHIRNYDVRLMVVAAVFAGGLTLAGDFVARSFRFGGSGASRPRYRLSGGGNRSKGGGQAMVAIMIAIAVLALVHFLAQFSRFAISRSREYMADAGAVELTKNPDALISALRKIAGNDQMDRMPVTVAAMMISAETNSMFATHPRIEDRIAALRDFAGGREAVQPWSDAMAVLEVRA